MTESSAGAPSDEDYRLAAIDLLGAIAYGELSAFERLAEDAKLAPSLEDKMAMGALATVEFGHLQRLAERLTQLGADPGEAMRAFQPGFDAFHDHTAPSDWYEGLIKFYVGDGLAADFYREIAAYLDPDTREVIISSLEDAGQTEFVVDRVRAGIAHDHRLGGRLALWGRRLMGEALTQAQRVAAERDALSALWPGEWTGQASTWRRSRGCSAGSPSATPSGWPSSGSTPERGRPAHRRTTKAPHRSVRGLLQQWGQTRLLLRPVTAEAIITRIAATAICQT